MTWRLLGAAVAALAAVSLIGCSALTFGAPPSDTDGADGAASASPRVLAGAEVTDTLNALPRRSVAPMPAARLAQGLAPPTNRWFSGLVFGPPQPVFPTPLSFALTGPGFAFGLPHVTSSANTISGGFLPDVTIDAGASSSQVVAYDEVSVTVALRDAAGGPIGTVLLAEGSPFVTFTAAKSIALGSSATFADAGGVATAQIGGTQYGVIAPGGAVRPAQLALSKGQVARWFPVPHGASAARVAAAAPGAVTGVETGYTVGKSTATTTLSYRTAGGATAVGALPHQQAGLHGPDCGLGHYATPYGELKLCATSTLSWSVPLAAASDQLDLSSLSAGERAQLVTQVRSDARASLATPTDTYGGGKALYRIANLLSLAHQLGVTDAESALRQTLRTQLETWTSAGRCASASAAQCFVYDPIAHGVIGLDASFGSEQFNDHHFHYGYLLYSAAVLARIDPGAVEKIAPVMNAVAADIASSGNSLLPTRRMFDPYAGHSWASGYAPFADGNNQESSSEAVNAWNGLALWAAATGQAQLGTEALWMMSAEADAARSYQLYPVLTGVEGFDGFAHRVVGIDWGSKRDFATWFSADPSAVLGIQLIPMSPASTYLGAPAEQITANLESVAPPGSEVQFGDYFLMYQSLAGGPAAQAARAAAPGFPEALIDSANSRSYLLAFVDTHGK